MQNLATASLGCNQPIRYASGVRSWISWRRERSQTAMEEDIRKLYRDYVRAVEFLNAHARSEAGEAKSQSRLTMAVVSEADFPSWWCRVCRDSELRQRWLERFADPEGAFTRSCEKIRETLGEIAFPRAA
jgi:hypothetical protein